MPEKYPVSLIRFTLALDDPDLPSPRYHTTIFVETEIDGSGWLHQVNGDITSPGGMQYDPKFSSKPEDTENFYSSAPLGVTDASIYPSAWNALLRGLPAPPRQKAFNTKTFKTEPFKTLEPLTFYEPGEPRRPLVKCTEWTLNGAIPALRSAGLIQ
ncbi:hypothetical protein ASPWEDRAFT_44301 [Aspergillus wentii DTO 134E9]|uniref:Uncharacterized protein n=1 Tax=Aspergillus wentii DTO 134E9 TaxID=1073089 RepID=A0A1L9RBF7_ASPWE|nr:uncharacterized protein ASPWEDRAFT_44301 [Aspergillus wentii DTO 134E9]KAI9934789.1 hypothetical protein MW887_000406 [Aspergillus wentii]OJJ32218.1 hypothetical protein ASPWEDRAFT_44301 [Aspergillus wentii DTO 134E9]